MEDLHPATTILYYCANEVHKYNLHWHKKTHKMSYNPPKNFTCRLLHVKERWE